MGKEREERDVAGKSYSLEAAEVASKALAAQEHLVVADLSDIIAGRPEELALQVLQKMAEGLQEKQLEEINLSDNAMGAKGVKASSSMIKGQKTLKRVLFCNDGLAPDAAELLAAYFLGMEPGEELGEGTSSTLEKIHLHNNCLIDGGALAFGRLLSRSPLLKDIRYSSTRASPDGSAVLAKSLEESGAKLHFLDLSDNGFFEKGSQSLGAMLRGQSELQVLRLGSIGLQDEGSEVVAKGLMEAGCDHLEEVDISFNEITIRGLWAWLEVLVHAPKLHTLILDNNEVGSAGARAIAAVMSNGGFQSLRVLRLASNEIKKHGATAIASTCVGHKRMQQLVLSENEVSDPTVAWLQGQIAQAGRKDLEVVMEECFGDEGEDADDAPDAEEAQMAQSRLKALAEKKQVVVEKEKKDPEMEELEALLAQMDLRKLEKLKAMVDGKLEKEKQDGGK